MPDLVEGSRYIKEDRVRSFSVAEDLQFGAMFTARPELLCWYIPRSFVFSLKLKNTILSATLLDAGRKLVDSFWKTWIK